MAMPVHPIFGDMSGMHAFKENDGSDVCRLCRHHRSAPLHNDEALRARSAEIKRMMEHQWRVVACVKPSRLARWAMPMKWGGTYGYYDGLAHD